MVSFRRQSVLISAVIVLPLVVAVPQSAEKCHRTGVSAQAEEVGHDGRCARGDDGAHRSTVRRGTGFDQYVLIDLSASGSEGVLRPREGAGPDLVGVGLRAVEEYAAHVGVLLDEPGHPPGAQAEGVLPDQHLAVAVDAGADADRRDGQLLGDRAATSPGTISITTANAPAASTAWASSRIRCAVSPRPCTR